MKEEAEVHGLEIVVSSDGETGEIAVLSLNGYVDASTLGGISEVVGEQLERGIRLLLLDLSGTTYVSGRGWKSLRESAKAARDAGGELAIASMSTDVRGTYELMNLASRVRHFDHLREAVAYLESTGGGAP